NQQRGGFAGGPSIDQVLAKRVGAGRPRASVEMAIRWATGKSHGLLHPINSMTFADDATYSPISPRLNPAEIFDSLFGNLDEDSSAGENVAVTRRASILDYLDRRYETLSQRLGAADRVKLEEHLDRVREMEEGLQALAD